MEKGKREKAERFTAFLYGKGEKVTSEVIAIHYYDEYPTDDELEAFWNITAEKGHRLHYINVEKQVRFN
jgi:hypothetical protein